jgi:hypothetical protein
MFSKPETRYDTLKQCIAELVLYDRLKRPEIFDRLSEADRLEIRAIVDAARHATTERAKRVCAERYYRFLKQAYDLMGV